MGITFNLQRYSTHDGPGIRTVLFLKGCSLSCHWCQNPESRSRSLDLGFDARLCLDGCRLCVDAAPAFQRDGRGELVIARSGLTPELIQTGCAACPSRALTAYGQEQSVAELMAQVRRDLPYFLKSLCAIDYVYLPELAPPAELLAGYRNKEIDWEGYEQIYNCALLARSAEQLIGPDLLDGGCLLCSEDLPAHCHRRLAAEYLKAHHSSLVVKHL